MTYNPEDRTRLKHLLELGGRIKKVTDAHETRIAALEDGSLEGIYCNTTNYWAQKKSFIPPAGAIVIYSDYAATGEKPVPAFKVGDGLAYVVDLPFSTDDLTARLEAHIADDTRHLTAQDRERLETSMRVSFVEKEDGSYTMVFN